MTQTTLPRQPFMRQIQNLLDLMHNSRLLPGLMISLVLIAVMLGRPTLFAELTSLRVQAPVGADLAQPVATTVQVQDDAVDTGLTPRMQAALDFVARKYHVSAEALAPVFIAAQKAGRESRLDPLLIVAVISIESRFNPYAESVVGAQGLMQVMPQWHSDKIPAGMGSAALFDPEINVHVGTQILRESIRREGGVMAGLQQFAGASEDLDLDYANKVLAQKKELETAAGRARSSNLI